MGSHQIIGSPGLISNGSYDPWVMVFYLVFIFLIWHLYKYCIEWKYQLYEYTLFANSRVSIYLCLSSGNFLNERDEKDPFRWHDEWKFWFEWIYSAGQRLLLPILSFTGSQYSLNSLNIDRTSTLTHAAPSLHWGYNLTPCTEGAKDDNVNVRSIFINFHQNISLTRTFSRSNPPVCKKSS